MISPIILSFSLVEIYRKNRLIYELFLLYLCVSIGERNWVEFLVNAVFVGVITGMLSRWRAG